MATVNPVLPLQRFARAITCRLQRQSNSAMWSGPRVSIVIIDSRVRKIHAVICAIVKPSQHVRSMVGRIPVRRCQRARTNQANVTRRRTRRPSFTNPGSIIRASKVTSMFPPPPDCDLFSHGVAVYDSTWRQSPRHRPPSASVFSRSSSRRIAFAISSSSTVTISSTYF